MLAAVIANEGNARGVGTGGFGYLVDKVLQLRAIISGIEILDADCDFGLQRIHGAARSFADSGFAMPVARGHRGIVAYRHFKKIILTRSGKNTR